MSNFFRLYCIFQLVPLYLHSWPEFWIGLVIRNGIYEYDSVGLSSHLFEILILVVFFKIIPLKKRKYLILNLLLIKTDYFIFSSYFSLFFIKVLEKIFTYLLLLKKKNSAFGFSSGTVHPDSAVRKLGRKVEYF